MRCHNNSDKGPTNPPLSRSKPLGYVRIHWLLLYGTRYSLRIRRRHQVEKSHESRGADDITHAKGWTKSLRHSRRFSSSTEIGYTRTYHSHAYANIGLTLNGYLLFSPRLTLDRPKNLMRTAMLFRVHSRSTQNSTPPVVFFLNRRTALERQDHHPVTLRGPSESPTRCPVSDMDN